MNKLTDYLKKKNSTLNKKMDNNNNNIIDISRISLKPANEFDPSSASREFNDNDKPIQPMTNFPSTKFGAKNRKFNSNWYINFPTLEYSIEMDAAFCFVCRKFSIKAGRQEDCFSRTGFRDWKHMLTYFQNHIKTESHNSAAIAYQARINSQTK